MVGLVPMSQVDTVADEYRPEGGLREAKRMSQASARGEASTQCEAVDRSDHGLAQAVNLRTSTP